MSQKVRRILLIVFITIAACFLLTGCSNKAKIGYIDIALVSTQSPQIKKINTDFENEYKKVNEQMEELVKKQGSMKPEDYTKEVQQIQRKAYGVQQKYNAKRRTVIDNVLAQISKEKGLSAVTIKSSVGLDPQGSKEDTARVDGVVVNGGIDITEEVIKKLQ